MDATKNVPVKSGMSRMKKMVCGVLCCIFILAAILVPIGLLVIWPDMLLRKLKDNLKFYPCDMKICVDGAQAGTSQSCTTLCHYNGPSFLGPPPDTCPVTVALRALTTQRLGFELELNTYNAINKLKIKHAAIVIKLPTAGLAASKSSALTPADYIAAGSLVACVLSPAKQTLQGSSWSPLRFHCELDASANLAPILTAVLAGQPLPTETTYSATAETRLGDRSFSDIYSPTDTTTDLMATSNCPAFDAFSQGLNLAGLSGYQCAMPGSLTFKQTCVASNTATNVCLPGCDVTQSAVRNSALNAVVCCIIKSTDGIGIMGYMLHVASNGLVGTDPAALLG